VHRNSGGAPTTTEHDSTDTDLPEAERFWDDLRRSRDAGAPRRIAAGPDGRTAEVVDHVLLLRRTAA
jgi:hypothetical protein